MLLQSWSMPPQAVPPVLLIGPQEIVVVAQVALAEHELARIGLGVEKIASSWELSAAAALG